MIWSRQHAAVGIIVLGVIITLANSWFSCALHTYQAELYPTRIRAQAVGFVYSWSRFSSIFVGFIIAQALKAYGTTGVFVIVATAMLIVAVVVRSEEHTSELQSLTNLVCRLLLEKKKRY